MDNLYKILAFIRNFSIIAVLSFVPLFSLFQNIVSNYNDRDADTGGVFLMLWIFLASIAFGVFSICKTFSFINIDNEMTSTSLYIILGFGANVIGLFVALGLSQIVYLTF